MLLWVDDCSGILARNYSGMDSIDKTVEARPVPVVSCCVLQHFDTQGSCCVKERWPQLAYYPVSMRWNLYAPRLQRMVLVRSLTRRTWHDVVSCPHDAPAGGLERSPVQTN